MSNTHLDRATILTEALPYIQRYNGKIVVVNCGGVAMNPVDHPLGGGEGRSSGGRHPVSPWGMPTKGYKTRDKKKPSSRLIVKRRGQK